jgi:hypothetical protein
VKSPSRENHRLCSEMWIRNGNEWTRLGHACRPWVELIASAANAALLQIADQESKRLERDRVLVCLFEHPTTDLRSETLTSISSRTGWCRQGWYA